MSLPASRHPLLALALAAMACLPAVRGEAAEIRLLSGNGGKAAVHALAAAFERASGHTVTVHFEVNAALERKIKAGEPFDAVVLNPPVIDALIAAGKLVASSRADIGHAGLGVGVRAAAPKPDIGSVEAFKQTLLAAKSVAYPGLGASGVYFAALVERLGIAEAMKPKMRPMPAEDTVEVVARGEADMVVVIASRIVGVPGIELVGPIPDALQTKIGITAAVGSAARDAQAAGALVHFFSAAEQMPLLRRFGIEPAVR